MHSYWSLSGRDSWDLKNRELLGMVIGYLETETDMLYLESLWMQSLPIVGGVVI